MLNVVGDEINAVRQHGEMRFDVFVRHTFRRQAERDASGMLRTLPDQMMIEGHDRGMTLIAAQLLGNGPHQISVMADIALEFDHQRHTALNQIEHFAQRRWMILGAADAQLLHFCGRAVMHFARLAR